MTSMQNGKIMANIVLLFRNYGKNKIFHVYFRMTIDCYYGILNIIRDDTRREDTNYRKSIYPEELLVITLR
jgi:hypothetical protein